MMRFRGSTIVIQRPMVHGTVPIYGRRASIQWLLEYNKLYKIVFKENAHIYLLSNINHNSYPSLAQLVERLTVEV